ncbi:ABC transporter permease [Myceligenerans xiligouense]|uniref:ABC-type transport system involved in multi-copper enzyme maturation permease subunit n=1 Tax=Myceligenerans xiligouense TaxID=253184 RepID=A0A3N4Z0T3_9MICO|nr:ABC transporter permease subunit [Myceligenerans xiligouense]RPF19698.1 ABC-type transport system involved in multi-copper enzyme maturation permease subunit [Myceligenerans xiligouense]
MTGTTTDAGGPAPAGTTADTGAERGTWSLSWHGLRTVTRLELRQRVRSTRWKLALVLWVVVVGLITGLTTWALAVEAREYSYSGQGEPYGGMIYSIVVCFVLFLGLLVAPTLSSGAINGDRNAGTLATLQVTLLSPAEIVLGKLAASWFAALAFLAASVPFILWALLAGGVTALALVGTLLMLAVVLGVVCAIGLGFSAIVTKPSAAAVLTYLTIGTVTVVLPILFGLLAPLTTTDDEVRVWTQTSFDPETGLAEECEWQTHVLPVWHHERTWWMLAPNPFVLVADAQPLTADPDEMDDVNLLAMLQYGVRYAMTDEGAERNECWTGHGGPDPDAPVEETEVTDRMAWPWGLGFNLLLGGAGVAVAVNRLRIPTGDLPRGTRVA